MVSRSRAVRRNKVAEGWTLLAFALARYPDKFCTHEVLCNSFRNPAHLAKMAATAQAISGGRVILGIGAGWNEEEYRAYGWPYPSTPVRIAQLSEAIELIRLMWTQSPATYKGEHYQITGAYCEPRPIPFRPSWWAATARSICCARWPSTRTGGTTASATTRPTPTSRRCSRATARTWAATTSRSVQVLRVGILIAETEAEVERLKGQPGIRPMQDIRVAGTPAQVTEALRAIIKRGAPRLTVNFADAPRPEGTQLFAERSCPISRAMRRAHLLRWRPRQPAQRTESTPRRLPSGAAS